MVYLSPEVKTIPGSDSFWTWANRTIPKSTFDLPARMNEDDIILRYSTLGYYPIPGKSVACLWEMYPQMRDLYGFDHFEETRLSKIFDCARYCTYRTVASPATIHPYKKYGSIEVIPLGVDTELFRPMNVKQNLRKKYELPQSKRIGIYIGTLHHMKGFVKLLQYAADNPDIYWVVVFGRSTGKAWSSPNAKIFTDVAQNVVAELINACDFYFCANRLGAYYMADWEAMSCNLPFIYISEAEPEFQVSNSPRDDVFQYGWNRENVQKFWFEFFERHGVTYK